jgi:hypothetical protein
MDSPTFATFRYVRIALNFLLNQDLNHPIPSVIPLLATYQQISRLNLLKSESFVLVRATLAGAITLRAVSLWKKVSVIFTLPFPSLPFPPLHQSPRAGSRALWLVPQDNLYLWMANLVFPDFHFP